MRGCLLVAIFPTIALALLTQEDRDSLLEAHNKARAEVSPPAANMHAMVWDSNLELVAQTWANQCLFEHSPGLPSYGENLAEFTSGHWPVSLAAELWLEEELFYTYDGTHQACQSGKVCGHYTQMIWADSSRLGCGAKECNGHTIVVCNYSPAGNYIGQFPYIVDSRSPNAPNNGWCTYCSQDCDKLCPADAVSYIHYPCSPDCVDQQEELFCQYVISIGNPAGETMGEKCHNSVYSGFLKKVCMKFCEYCICDS